MTKRRRHKYLTLGGIAAGIIVAVAGATAVAVWAFATPTSPSGITANIFVGAAGSCRRASVATTYNASTSCATHQAACDATRADDVVGVEPGTYTKVQVAYSATCSGTAGHPKTWKPDNGIVRYIGTIGASWDAHAFDIGVSGKASPGPPSYETFDGGVNMNFRTGLPTDGSAGSGRPGAVHIDPYYSGSFATSRYPIGITLTHWVICYKCPNTATGDAELAHYSCQHCTISYSQLGPICCGNTCDPTCETSTTGGSGSPVVYGPQGKGGGAPDSLRGSYNAFVHNTVLGETHLPDTYWPSRDLGPAPQGTCSSCHTDCAQITVQDHIIIDYNYFYNCQTQSMFFDSTGGGWDSGEVIGNFSNATGSGGISFLGNGGILSGNWIFAFNTTNAALGSSGNSAADAGNPTLTYIGNYGPFAWAENGGDSESCASWLAATPGAKINASYNVVTNGSTCSRTDVVTCSPINCGPTRLDVAHIRDWTHSPPDNRVDYHLDASGVAYDVVPRSTCASVVSIAQSINGADSWAQAADIDRSAMGSSRCNAGADERLARSAHVGEMCKLKGTRYSGRTSQGKPICFTIASSGRISEYAYGFRTDCGSEGTSRTHGGIGTPIANGRFTAKGIGGSFFKGQVSHTAASGTLRSKKRKNGQLVPPVTCDTGIVRWNATRKN